MVITETLINNTTVFMNPANGAMLPMTKGVTDLQIINTLCTDYRVFIAFLSIVVIILIIAKGSMYRWIRKKPSMDESIKKLYASVDNILDMLLLLLMIVQLGIILFG